MAKAAKAEKAVEAAESAEGEIVKNGGEQKWLRVQNISRK